jgi:hypothetical protein
MLMKPLLLWKSNKYYIFLCVQVPMGDCMHMCERGCTGAGICLCICILTYPACNTRAILSPVASLAPPHFLTFSHKRHNFQKNVTKHKICVLIFSSTLFEIFLILRTIQWDIVINVKCVILVGFKWNLDFLNRFSNRAQVLNVIKICPVGTGCSMQTERYNERTVVSHNF